MWMVSLLASSGPEFDTINREMKSTMQSLSRAWAAIRLIGGRL
jgi:hypothetical protein